MIRPFNNLTPAQAERLALLAEECGEVQQAIGKILRHGYAGVNPDDRKGVDNTRALERELGDVLCVVDMLCQARDLYMLNVEQARRAKRERVAKFLHHQDKL